MERITRLIKPIGLLFFAFFSVYIISCEKTKTPPTTNPTKSVTYPFMSSLVVYNGNLSPKLSKIVLKNCQSKSLARDLINGRMKDFLNH